MTGDPFGTGALRARVLRAWADSPARFREDANTEEDHALGGYRDRVVIELAQNAADAAVRGGVPGFVRFTLSAGELTAANTGAALTAAGVEALSTLRASDKRGDGAAVGRFGVGFAAVVSVSDEPSIVSVDGVGASPGVRWSRADARHLVTQQPALAEELTRRDEHVPLLRLPFPAEGTVPPGYTTLVRLPFRDAAAAASVTRQLDDLGPALLLALPALEAVEIVTPDATRVITPGDARTVEDHGTIPPGLLADRPVEERARPQWSLRWALPRPGDAPPVLHAPTPSDERLDFPALLIGSFPLAPDRRHIAAGPLTDFLADRAADLYVRLLRATPSTPALLDLVPGPVGAGELDAAIRSTVRDRLPDAPLLPGGTRGRDATAIDGPAPLIDLLGEDVVPGLLPSAWPARHPALAVLGVRRLELADVVDALAALERDPAWWTTLYETLRGAPSDALGALPVPLASGRLTRGPRGLLIADHVDPAGLDVLGLRFVDPAAAHPLLLRLGAVEAGPREVLADPAVRAAVENAFDADDPGEITAAVLGLVAAARLDPGDLPWLADLPLEADDGDLYPAGELLLPGSPLRDVMADDAPFGVVSADVLDRWGAATLTAAGVLDGFALVTAEDVDLIGVADGDTGLDLDDEDRWADHVLDRLGPGALPPLVPEFTAVRDLELVDDWPAALRLLAAPPHRAAVLDPVHVTQDGRRATVASYTAWWLRARPVLDGRRPGEYRLPDSDLAGLYDPAPADLDPRLLAALGVRTTLAALLDDPDGPAELLARLADPSRTVPRDHLSPLWTALAGRDVPPPTHVRALVDGTPEIVDASDALILDHPALIPLLTGQPLIVASYPEAEALAETLDLPLASDEIEGTVTSEGKKTEVPTQAHALLPNAPSTYIHHEHLTVDQTPVDWWTTDSDLHATTPSGLARALTWTTETWHLRHLLTAALTAPTTLPTLLTESDLEP
ncbi:sacsin N-terminal ATP-binding-like domain-containing protein [Actinomadura flavalba]|uniref:sacsin N-terminal ATP-binding-like domain-containing protein n=1 Tax=Actinomadura flavalba TaxID=1120938 RepID=UPI0003664A61|nr:hypothetical protein [Actinomadura flavalba]